MSDDEDEDDNDPKQLAANEGGAAGISAAEAAEAIAFREQQKGTPPKPVKSPVPVEAANGSGNFPKLTPQNLERLLRAKYQNGDEADGEEGEAVEGGQQQQQQTAAPGGPPQYVEHFKAPRGKMVAVPIRVEPKVYFANGSQSLLKSSLGAMLIWFPGTERTFLVSRTTIWAYAKES